MRLLALGRLYLKGVGVPQYYILAHMWFNLAASRGEMEALKERNALAAKMTAAERAEAQKRAREWRLGGGPKAVSTKRSPTSLPPARAIREAQELLAALGYKPGPVDGKWGARSATAYAAFLRHAGLPPGDMLTPKGLRAMRDLAKRRKAGMATGSDQSTAPPKPLVKTLPPDALHRAVLAGDIDGLNAALKAGVDVNGRDRRGWTALMHAANKGFKLVVGPLLKAKADPDIQAADGATALFMATVHGHSEIIELLVKAGSDVSIKGPKGKRVLDVLWTRYGGVKAARNNEGAAVITLLETEEATRIKEKWPTGKEFRDCSNCPEMVVIPAGSFNMGDRYNKGDKYWLRVRIPRPIAVGKYEVTFEEWDTCVAGGGCRGYRPLDAYWGRGRRPVLSVSWGDAKAYVEWLSRMTREEYRLLSESEWEYAARAGTTGRSYFGETISTAQANVNDGKKQRADQWGTVPVGSFPANDFGLHEMYGNVEEWVEDCWHWQYTDRTPTDGSAWVSGGDCGKRVMRGGSWASYLSELGSTRRSYTRAGARSGSGNGFRIARTLTP